MTHDQAMKLSEVGIAVRYNAAGRLTNYCSGSQPPAGIPPDVQGHAEGFIRQTHGTSKPMPPDYAGIYKDWEPWQPKDAVTALGDILRIVDPTFLVARLAG